MQTRLRAGRLGTVVSGYLTVTAFSGTLTAPILLAGCMPPPAAEGAWHRYLQAEIAYENCSTPRHRKLCQDERTALEAARADYHAAEAGAR